MTARGNNRQNIFETDDDKWDYLTHLQKIFRSQKIRLLVYCIMTNHLHLLVQDVLGGGLIAAMQRLQTWYAQRWNRKYGRTGHVFGERYNPQPIESESHLIIGSCYIHNNPNDAGIVAEARDYRWSSIKAYLGGVSDLTVSTDLILSLCGGPSKYAALVRESAGSFSAVGERLPEAWKVRDIWVTGSEKFREKVEDLVERRSDRRVRERPEGLTLGALWECVRAETGVTRNEICSDSRIRRISYARAYLCMLARREGIPAVDVAQAIKRTISAVVHLAARFVKKAEHHD